MIDQEIAHRDFEAVEDLFACPADAGSELPFSLVAWEKARDVLARTREDAAMEALDVLSQSDEALVMG